MEPLPLPDRRDVVERYSRVLASVGSELGTRALVLPNSTFFPDRFQGDAASAAILVDRMLWHAGMDDVPVTTRVVSEDAPEAPHQGCSSGCQIPAALSGSVPRLLDTGDGWSLQIPDFELAHPVVLTTMIARALGHVFLAETLPVGVRPEAPEELTADYAAVALGFGALLLEGAYIYSKGCGGPQVAQVTSAGISELAIATALFAETNRHSVRSALRELGTTQSALLGEAHDWVKSNGELVRALRDSPDLVAAGGVPLHDHTPWLVRLFRKAPAAPVVPARPPERRVAAPDAVQDELRDLVAEALRDARADAE